MTLLGARNTTGDQAAASIASSSFKQNFFSPLDGLDTVEIIFETPPTNYDRQVTISLFSAEDELLREVSEIVPTTTGDTFIDFKFEPIPDSKGKEYYFTVDSEIINAESVNADTTDTTMLPPQTVHLKYAEHDYYLQGQLFVNDQPSGGDLVFRTFHDIKSTHHTYLAQSVLQKITADTPFILGWTILMLCTITAAVISLRKNLK